MANRFLRTIAVGIGAGLAVGLGKTLAARQTRPAAPNFTPILTRLDNIESRVARVELTPAIVTLPAPEEIEAIGTLVSSQSEDIATLRDDILRIEWRNTEQVEAFGRKVALLERQVPATVETAVNARMAELEHKLRGEFHEIHYRTVDAFSETIEKRVIGRINALENSLIDQSRNIVSLREKLFKTDDHLQRLLDAVEKLCARAEAQTPLSPTDRPMPPSAPPSSPSEHASPESSPGIDRLEPGHHAESEHEAEMVFAAQPSDAVSPQPRRSLKPMGMAILGLAILSFRFIR